MEIRKEIIVKNIAKTYAKRPVLKNVSINIKQGEAVGLLGPNGAGKTTCFYCITGLITPDLGSINLPGLIEGASEGVGLGHRFLGHAERCKIILHLIDGTSEDVVASYKTIQSELLNYGDVLEHKPEIIVLNKIDSLSEDEVAEKIKKLKRASKKEVIAISGIAQIGLEDLKKAIYKILSAQE